MDIEEIKALQNEVVKLLKGNSQAIDKKKLLDFNPIYKEAVELAEAVAIHAELDNFPDKLFREKAPNEDPKEFKWRKDNYRPFTRALWTRAENVTNRVWNKQNYAINWKEDTDAVTKAFSPKTYFETEYPVFGSLETYFKLIATKTKIRRPNAVLCIKPQEIPTFKNEAGDLVAKDNVLLEPIAIIYREDQVLKFEDKLHCMVWLDEKSMVDFGGKQESKGNIFEVYDENTIWRITQTGKFVDWTFQIEEWYTHNWGEMPCQKLRGIPEMREEYLIYKCPYADGIPILNEVLCDTSTLQASKVAHAFLQKWEYVDVCEAQGCGHNGHTGMVWDEGREAYSKCSSCNGTGVLNKASVFGVYQIQKPQRLDPNDAHITPPPADYIKLDPAILIFLREEIDNNSKKFLDMLNIDLSKDQATGKDTATGRILDREEMFSFLLNFSHEIFDLYQFTIEAIGFMRYGNAFVSPDIKRPNNFSIRSEDDLTQELATAKNNALPQSYVQELEMELYNIRFPNSELMTKKYRLATEADSLSSFSIQEISIALAAGTVYKWQSALHINVDNFIEEAIAEDSGFMDLDLKDQKAKLVEMSKAFVAENTVKLLDASTVLNGIGAN